MSDEKFCAYHSCDNVGDMNLNFYCKECYERNLKLKETIFKPLWSDSGAGTNTTTTSALFFE